MRCIMILISHLLISQKWDHWLSAVVWVQGFSVYFAYNCTILLHLKMHIIAYLAWDLKLLTWTVSARHVYEWNSLDKALACVFIKWFVYVLRITCQAKHQNRQQNGQMCFKICRQSECTVLVRLANFQRSHPHSKNVLHYLKKKVCTFVVHVL